MLKKVVLIAPKNTFLPSYIQHMETLLKNNKVESIYVTESDDIIAHSPDCVIALSPEVPKLTHFPTYGLMQQPISSYLELPRYLRNILTYDGYLTVSEKTQQSLADLLFGARKLNTQIARFDFTSNEISAPCDVFNHVFYFEPNISKSIFSKALGVIQETLPDMKIGSYRWGFNRKVILLSDNISLQKAYQSAGVGLNLSLSDDENQVISPQLLEIIATGAAAIAPFTKTLHKLFGDALWYFSPTLEPKALAKAIKNQLILIQNQPGLAKEKAERALKIYNEKFAFSNLFNNLAALHAETLIKKGFKAKDKDEKLPSITYIIRTGGNNREHLERALKSLLDQNYSNLKVLFVTHAKFSYMDEMIAKYPSLQIKTIHCEKSIRSKAICLGMAAIDTDLFGMLDDDDEIHPNHVRSLVNTLKYHNNRDWRGPIKLAYSGSIIVNPHGAYETENEFLDQNLKNHSKKRVIEHFRFYKTYSIAHHQWFMMSNSWLADRSILDDELLTDPAINTCEDLYFELQFAQRTHFAFSVEATAYHHFHLNNSTIVDSEAHIPDTTRIALRNFSRSFPGEFIYDSVFNPAGLLPLVEEPNYADNLNIPRLKHCISNATQRVCTPQYLSGYHAYDPEVEKQSFALRINSNPDQSRIVSLLFRPFEIVTLLVSMGSMRRSILIGKAKKYYHQHGIIKLVFRTLTYGSDIRNMRVTSKLTNDINLLFFPIIVLKRFKRILSRFTEKKPHAEG